jgi:hypothetical protein
MGKERGAADAETIQSPIMARTHQTITLKININMINDVRTDCVRVVRRRKRRLLGSTTEPSNGSVFSDASQQRGR